MSGQIFISYRREESRWSARSLHDRLTQRFDRNQIFMDVDSVSLGEDFVKTIEETVGSCEVLIALIGKGWLTSCDQEGKRRLDNPDDFVRTEIATALKRGIRVIPVLLDGALTPRSTDLPDDLEALAGRQALAVSDTGFDDDCRRLVAAIGQVFEEKERPEGKKNEGREAEPKSQNKELPTRSILRLAGLVCYIVGVFFAIIGILFFLLSSSYEEVFRFAFMPIAISAFFLLAGFLIRKRTALKK